MLIPQDRIRTLGFSHVCIDLPSLPAAAEAGRNATIRLRYVAEYLDPAHAHDRRRHLPVNETYYSCADVTLMARDEFFRVDDIPCFNATGDFEADDHAYSHADGDGEEASTAAGGSDNGLSKGGIAGIVIGVVVGFAVMATALWYLVRRDRRRKQAVQHTTAETKSVESQAS